MLFLCVIFHVGATVECYFNLEDSKITLGLI